MRIEIELFGFVLSKGFVFGCGGSCSGWVGIGRVFFWDGGGLVWIAVIVVGKGGDDGRWMDRWRGVW